MFKKLTRGHRWVALPVALIAATGVATTVGGNALSLTSHQVRVCANLDAREARQQAALANAVPNSRHYFLIQASIAQTEQQEANHGCGD
jgi:hypothetical protein